MRAGGAGLLSLRSFQYSRTANFRAMATFATVVPRRNALCDQVVELGDLRID